MKAHELLTCVFRRQTLATEGLK